MRRSHGYVHPAYRDLARAFDDLIPASGGGAALAVFHHGEPVVEIAGGTRDEHGAPFANDTLALSFSTTKGIASTLLHILVSQGHVAYDDPVARHWPAFGAGGKEAITVRDVMTHRAGLASIRALVDDAHQMLDWDGMLTRLEAAVPDANRGRPCYHGLTYGWLVGGLVEKVSKKPFREALRAELVEPLGLTGCYVGLPASELGRAARLVRRAPIPRPHGPKPPAQRAQQALFRGLSRLVGLREEVFRDALLPKGIPDFDWTADATLAACIPAASGTFDARSLARVYAMLAGEGELDGKRLIDRATFHELSRVQTRQRDAVLPMPMEWRLGYHRVLSLGIQSRPAFGHFGFGGSGAFCDPSRRLAVGFVLNHGVGTPFGDARIWRLAAKAMEAADRRSVRVSHR